MNDRNKNELLFDALLQIAATEAFQTEIESMPTNDELNDLYPSTPELDMRIKGLIEKSRKKVQKRILAKKAGRIAASISIAFVIVTAALLSVQATRNIILNAVLDIKEKFTVVQFDDSTTDSVKNVYRPSYLPQGFSEKSIEKMGRGFVSTYHNNDGESILFFQQTAGNGSTAVDNEHHVYEEVQISGKKAHLFKGVSEEYSNVLIWESNNKEFTLTSQIDSEELIKIGESLKK